MHFATNFDGEVTLDLGPIGKAYLDSPVAPIGVTMTVGGVGAAAATFTTLFSEQTLAAYTSLYAEPEATIAGITERLVRDAVVEALQVEALLLLGFAGWRLRGQLLAPWVIRHVTRRRVAAAYVTVVALVVGSIVAPDPVRETRYPVALAAGTEFASLSVDSVVLADVLDRGIKGIRLLSGRQQRAVQSYIDTASVSLGEQLDRMPAATPGRIDDSRLQRPALQPGHR